GFTIGCTDCGRIYHHSLKVPETLGFVVLIPDFTLPTDKSRSVLPATVKMSDAVHNLSRAAMVVSSILTGELKKLTIAVDDRLHEPYRKPLIPDFDKLKSKAYDLGAYAACISGAGPSILCLVHNDSAEGFVLRINEFIKENAPRWRAVRLYPANGARVEVV
ncbi:MAG TPA: homoserine kinase, partial [Clostridia bacterium]|nr:homoserine kinase [Clostridia bacterium]